MSKLDKIKAELAKLLLKYAVIKTDIAVLEYTGDEELKEGMEVYITDENGEKVSAKDGEYKTDDNKVITVADGKVASIVEVNETAEGEETPAEMAEDEKPAEEPKEDEKPAEDENKPAEDPKEDEIKLEDVNEAIENLRKEVDELYKIVDSLLKKVGETRDEADERLKKLECSSQAKPAVDEFEQAKQSKKTGDTKLDKFLSKYGK